MKTMAEALAQQRRNIQNSEALDVAVAELRDLHQRYKDLADEAIADENLQGMMTYWQELYEEHGPGSGLFTAFMAGLVAGMEMEKP